MVYIIEHCRLSQYNRVYSALAKIGFRPETTSSPGDILYSFQGPKPERYVGVGFSGSTIRINSNDDEGASGLARKIASFVSGNLRHLDDSLADVFSEFLP